MLKKKQKWPLLNLVRQILKVNNYRMKPIRKSDGKTKLGKKKYIRFFNRKIEKNERTGDKYVKLCILKHIVLL